MNNFYVNDPQTWWYHKQAAIEDVTMEVRPAGKFYEVDLYMTYRVNPNEYTSEFDTFEVVHFSDCPATSPLLIHGCGLETPS